MENNREKLLEVKNLNVSFHTYAGEVKAVRGLDFHLYPGAVSYTHLTLPTNREV